MARIDHTRGDESRAFWSPVSGSFSSPQTFLTTVFCFFLIMHCMAHACSIVLDRFLHDSVAFVCSLPLRLCFLLTN